jgi:hypothetical protein
MNWRYCDVRDCRDIDCLPTLLPIREPVGLARPDK